jgi:hypothetical protein
LAYTHNADFSASYDVKKRSSSKAGVKKQWTGVTDMTGRGFSKDESTLTKGFKWPREHIRAADNMD